MNTYYVGKTYSYPLKEFYSLRVEGLIDFQVQRDHYLSPSKKNKKELNGEKVRLPALDTYDTGQKFGKLGSISHS